MKTSIYILLFMITLNLNSFAQRVTKQERISNNSTLRGKKLLRKENKIHASVENLADKNENRSRRKNKLGTLSNYKSQKKIVTRERKRAKKEQEKTEKQALRKEKGNRGKETVETTKEPVVATMGPEESPE